MASDPLVLVLTAAWSREGSLVDAINEVARAAREHIAAEIEAVDPVEWALAGQNAGADAARIARGQS